MQKDNLKYSRKILEKVIAEDIKYSAMGDFEEIYNEKVDLDGVIKAKLWIWLQIFKSIPSFLTDSTYWRYTMLQSYIKIAFRNIRRYKMYSAINIFGLSVGLACSIILLIFVQDESGYDDYHTNKDNIYRLNIKLAHRDARVATSSLLWGMTLKKDYPEVKDSFRLTFPNNGWEFDYENKKVLEDAIHFADANVFKHFSWDLVHGDPDIALTEKNSLVLSQTVASRYFGSENPVGKTIKIRQNPNDENNRIQTPYTVTGVMKDIPKKTHLRPEVLVSMNGMESILGIDFDDADITTGVGFQTWFWRGRVLYNYLELEKNTDIQALEEKFKAFLDNYPINSETISRGYGYELYLQKLEETHYSSRIGGEPGPTTNMSDLYVFFVIALFILTIACTNFTNLLTARSSARAKEVGLRKVVGAERKQLISQFLGESIILTGIAFFIALVLSRAFLPVFYEYAGKEFNVATLEYFTIIPFATLLCLSVGFFAGIYPSFFLSAFQPKDVLSKSASFSSKGSFLRKGLIVFQFSISIFLIFSTITVVNQINYMKNSALGFDKEQTLLIPPGLTSQTRQNYNTIKDDLSTHSGIVNISGTSKILGNAGGGEIYGIPESDGETIPIDELWVDHNYMEHYGLELVAGRTFSLERGEDNGQNIAGKGPGLGLSIMINEATVSRLGYSSPQEALGNKLNRDPVSIDFVGNIIGVVKNFNYESLHEEIGPMVFVYGIGRLRYMSIKIEKSSTSEVISFLEDKFKSIAPEVPFTYSFLDERYERLYQSEERIGRIFSFVTMLALAIACLGLFGLASFSTAARSKEIGIRKILGASSSTLIATLSKEYVILVTVANLISWPIAYMVMEEWLSQFAYKIALSPLMFLSTGLLALGIALMTVGIKSYKTAVSNPSDTLRYE